MLYDYYQGAVSLNQVGWRIVGEIKGLLPGADAQEIFNSATLALKNLQSSADGISWVDMGGLLLDLATLIVKNVGVGKVVDVAGALWDVVGVV
ncbi:hypothetical protein [Bacillus manliponensis]|uniref:hypothetical protein n=1 Tax=Bacillus manliponensis TaxID=574376 RepID=UPI000552FA1D|nr:hypothetical protein [Bacillus manliponensis]